MWSGSSIPSGWALCNGQTVNGQATPNLQDKFVVGAGSGYSVGSVGGEATKTLGTANLPSHTHTAGSLAATGGNHSHSFSGSGSNTHNHNFKSVQDGADADQQNRGINHSSDEGIISYDTYKTENASISITVSGTTGGSGNLSLGVGGNTGDQGGAMGQAFENLPPYYAIAYIMRIS